MRRKFFIRRVLHYSIIIMIPALLLFFTFYVLSTRNEEEQLIDRGEQTIQSVAVNCETIISSVAEQNNLLTTATRMSFALRHMLKEDHVSYADSVNMNALRTTLDSITASVPVIDNILIWLDDAPRVFSSTGDRIMLLQNAQSVPWLEAYQQMPEDRSFVIIPNRTAMGTPCITVIRRLLLQDGCTIVNINAEKWIRNLRPMLHREHEHVFLVSAEGRVLLHVSDDDAVPVTADEEMSHVLGTGSHQWIRLDGSRYLSSFFFLE